MVLFIGFETPFGMLVVRVDYVISRDRKRLLYYCDHPWAAKVKKRRVRLV